MGIENNISTMTIPVISPDDSRHFATLGEISQQQMLVISYRKLENHPFILFFLALNLVVISWVVDIAFCSITELELDTNIIALEWSLTSVTSIIYQQATLTKTM